MFSRRSFARNAFILIVLAAAMILPHAKDPLAAQVSVRAGELKPNGLPWDTGLGRLFGEQNDELPDIKICWQEQINYCAPVCWNSTSCSVDIGEPPGAFTIRVYDADRSNDDDFMFSFDVTCGMECENCAVGRHRISIRHQCGQNRVLDLLQLGRELSQATRDRLFINFYEPSRFISQVTATTFNVRRGLQIGSYRRLTMQDGTVVGFIDPNELDGLNAEDLAWRSVFKLVEAVGVDSSEELGWATNCHGVTFLGGLFWLNDANTILRHALTEIPQSQIQVGDFVLWRDAQGRVSHSATVVAVGSSPREIQLYQDAGGLTEHIVTLQEHLDGSAPGSEDAANFIFSRIRADWP